MRQRIKIMDRAPQFEGPQGCLTFLLSRKWSRGNVPEAAERGALPEDSQGRK